MKTDIELIRLIWSETMRWPSHKKFVGLCTIISHLSRYNRISWAEFDRLNEILTEDGVFDLSYHEWRPGRKWPRIQYLNRKLNQNEKI